MGTGASMATSYYGPMRATDGDRENVHAALQSAYADGRLTWDEFDARSSKLVVAKTYDELSVLTRDLRKPVPYQPSAYPIAVRTSTNPLAGISFGFGVAQVVFPFFGSIVAIVCGHVARSQIRRTGEQGDGLALAGMVLGYIGVVIPLLIVALIVGVTK
jgi:cytochrome c biogenesis protein CcdA